MQKKTLIIVLSSILVVLLGVVAFLAIYMFGQTPADTTSNYQNQLDLGSKYVESGDYEQAIAAYRTAIGDHPDDDEPYYLLAGLYRKLNRLDDMRSVLSEGIERTSSGRLIQLFEAYFGAYGADQNSSDPSLEHLDNDLKETNDSGIYISYSNTRIIANYDFEEYSLKFKNPRLTHEQNVYVYEFDSFPGQVCFFDVGETVSIDPAASQPYGHIRPNYVKVNSLNYIFEGAGQDARISETDVSSFGASVTKSQAFDDELGSYISFTYNNCVFDIAVDENRTFGMDSAHRLYSAFGTGAEEAVVTTEPVTIPEETTPPETTAPPVQFYTNSLFIGDATTGVGVPNANVTVHEGDSIGGAVVYTTTTNAEGRCTVELAVGNYCVEVNCSGYIVEAFLLQIYNTGVASAENFTISPELTQGEVRIVLEWGDYPRDLDSYLVGESGDFVYFGGRSWVENGETVAQLDVDDTDGFGPETITVYDTSKNFTYFVDDYNRTGGMFQRQDVTVKVYLPGAAAPTVYTIPASSSGAYGWCVFSFIDGRIVTHNTEIPEGRGGFTHQG